MRTEQDRKIEHDIQYVIRYYSNLKVRVEIFNYTRVKFVSTFDVHTVGMSTKLVDFYLNIHWLLRSP